MQGVNVDDPGKTRDRLQSELARLRQKIADLEASESRQQTADITERKLAEGELHQRAQLSALGAAVGLALTHTGSLAGALQQCAEALVSFMGAAFARIWTLNEREGVLELQASAGLYTHVNGSHGRVPVGQFKIGRIARDRKPHLTNTVIGDPEVSDQDWARRAGMVAFAGHPLIVDGRVVGVMALFARHPLSDAVISEMASVADHIALGIERDRSTAALAQSEARKAAVLDSVLDCIVTMDADGKVIEFNAAAERTFGYTKAEVIGRTLSELIIPPVLREAHDAGLARYFATGDGPLIGKLVEIMAMRKDGAEIPVELAITAIRSGAVPIFTGVLRDITSRKKVEAEFKRLNDEIQLQRLRVFKATMRTVQDIVNNLLNGLQLVHLEAAGHVPAEVLTVVERAIQEAAVKLTTLSELETVTEKEMALGLGIDYPGSAS